MKAQARYIKEYNDLEKDKGFKVWQVDNDVKHWKAVVEGPPNSMYEGRNFQVDIKIAENYPFMPPKIQFDTKLAHPNISPQTGDVCLNILRDGWSPALSIKAVLLKIQAMLMTPEPTNSQDFVITGQTKEKNINGVKTMCRKKYWLFTDEYK